MTITQICRSTRYLIERHILRRRYLVAKAKAGTEFAFCAPDAVGRYLYKHGTYETEVADYLFGIRPGNNSGWFVDVGANIGYYSVQMARRGFRVLAVEPDPVNCDLLNENIRRNDCITIRTVRAALSDTCGTQPFYRYPEKNLGRHSLLPINQGEAINVPTRRLDSLLGEQGIALEDIAIIKIDIEGYEPLALRGMEQTLRAASPVVVAEFSPGLMAAGGLEAKEYVQFMQDLGYSAARLGDTGTRPITSNALLATPCEQSLNLLWARDSQVAASESNSYLLNTDIKPLCDVA